MRRYPHTIAGSILLLGAAIMFTGAAFVKSEFETLALFGIAILFSLGGLILMRRNESLGE